MDAIFFLLRKDLKNTFLRKQTIFELLLYIYILYCSNHIGEVTNINVLLSDSVISSIFLIFNLFLTLVIWRSLKKNNIWRFEKSDFQYLLPAPISERYITLIGFLRKNRLFIKIVLFSYLPFCIVFRIVFGCTFLNACVCVTVLYLTLVQIYSSIVLCIFCNRNSTYLILGLSAAAFLCLLLPNIMREYVLFLIPIIGWNEIIVLGQINIINKNLLFYISVCLCAVSFITLIYKIIKSSTNFSFEWGFNNKKTSVKKNITNKNVHYLSGGGAIFTKQVQETYNRRKKLIFDVKLCLFLVLSVMISIGLTQTCDKEGNILMVQQIVLVLGLIMAIICMYLAPDNGYNEFDIYYFRMIPCTPQVKLFFMSLLLYIKSLIIGGVSFAIAFLIMKYSLWYYVLALVFFLSLILLFSITPAIYKKFFGGLDKDSIVSIYLGVIINIIFCMPGVLAYSIIEIISAPFVMAVFVASLINVLLFCIIAECTKSAFM